MKLAFLALVTTTWIALTDAANTGALLWDDGTDYVTGKTPNDLEFSVQPTTAITSTGGTLTFTSTQPLFNTVTNGALKTESASQVGSNPAIAAGSVVCTAKTVIKVECKMQGTAKVLATSPLVIKLSNGVSGGTNAALAALPAAGTAYSFTGATSNDGVTFVTVPMTGFTVQKSQIKSGKVVMPPSSHVTGTTPTSFQFEIQPRMPLANGNTITITSSQVTFTAGGALTTAAVAQAGNVAMNAVNMVSCTVAADKMTVTCTLANGAAVRTSSALVVSLTNNVAKLTPLGAANTEYKFSYTATGCADVLGPQLGFVVVAPQMKSAAVTLTPSTYYTGSTPTAIEFNLQLRQPLTVGGHIIITSSQTGLSTSLGALTIKSVSNGAALPTTNFAAEVVSTTQLRITINAGGSISNTAPFIISLVNGPVAKFAELGAVGQVVKFDFKTSLATTGLSAAGWTVVVGPTNPTGTSFLPAAVAAGATCVQIYDTSGFYKGSLVQFGKYVDASSKVEIKTIMGIYASTDCSGAEKTTSRRLAPTSMGTIRLDSGLTNSYPADTPIAVVNPSYSPTCFPGDATVNVYGRGATDVASLSVGDSVLVESVAGGLAFAPVLAFLHKVPGTIGMSHESVTVVHSQGTFRASANHLAFVLSEGGVRGDMPVSALRPGDQLLVQSASGKEMPSLILSIGLESTSAGMYAPFTSSGALVVDGVIASNYGAPSSGVSLPHGAAHAAFFALRMFHHLDFGIAPKLDLVMPFVKMMFQHLRLDKHA